MSDTAAHRRNIGPWPVKRSQSVPDTSNRIFTPQNSPPSLARMLGNVDEEARLPHYSIDDRPKAMAFQQKWSEYSIQQPTVDLERDRRPRRQHPSVRTRPLDIVTVVVRAVFTISMVVLILAPGLIAYYVKKSTMIRVTLVKEAVSTGLLYFLIYLWTTAIGAMFVLALLYSDAIGKKRPRRAGRAMMSVPGMFVIGALLAVLWVAILWPLVQVDERNF